MQILNTQSLYYDDVNLIAQPQNKIKSRTDIPKELDRIIISPMSAVVGKTFARKALELGLSVCVPRFGGIERQKEILENCSDYFNLHSLCVSVGLDDWKSVEGLKIYCRNILIDVANGYLKDVAEFASRLKMDGFNVMVGNVHSRNGVECFSNSLIRCGIGGGSVCQTSLVSGYTRGQITELMECADGLLKRSTGNGIIADGGVKDSGCAVKAFGAGADYVMMGGYFSYAEEAESVINGDLTYWGGASEKQQILQYGEKRRHSEGKVVSIDKSRVKPLKELVDDLWGGISSGVSYSGYGSLSEFIGNGVFEVKHSK